MLNSAKPKVGLALSGSGDRTTFYIGFLESLSRQNVPIDYISACSGGSLVAAAYACGALEEFKKEALSLNGEGLKHYIAKSRGRGGFYSLDVMEEKLRGFTKGKTFEEVRPLMSFVTVDIETGEQINLCIGDIARAARVSCTLPGVFEPVKWGNRTLVDGGLLSQIPLDSLKQFPVDVTVGVNMRGTKHIFTQGQISLKKLLNLLGKLLFVSELGSLVRGFWDEDEDGDIDFERNPSTFTVLSKSLNLAIAAEKTGSEPDISCDLMIVPSMPPVKRDITEQFTFYYEMGKKCAEEFGPKILQLVEQKQKIMDAVKS